MSTVDASVCLLVINRIESLPEIALKSIAANCDARIYIGYLNIQDVSKLLLHKNTIGVDLSGSAKDLQLIAGESSYKDFGSYDFFQLVQLKWELIRQVNETSKSKILIYSDLDVVWLRNPTGACLRFFEENENTSMVIQDLTSEPDKPLLCMGFVSFRCGPGLTLLVQEFGKLHQELLRKDASIGDDDVVTKYYRDRQSPQSIRLLPQTTFPTGNLISLFLKKQPLPGMKRVQPYIFHANFVVGLHKKLLLIFIFLIQSGNEKAYFDYVDRCKFLFEIFSRRINNSLPYGDK
jgi:hypothetical protein